MTAWPDDAFAPDFLGFDDARSAARFLDRSDVVFECTHESEAHGGGITVGRRAVVIGPLSDLVRIETVDVVGWAFGAPADLTVLTIWSERPDATHETTVLRRFTAAASAALTEVFGSARTPVALRS